MQADNGVQRLKEKVDTLIVIPNDRLLTVANDKTSVLNAFKMADEVLLQGVSGITGLITTPGLINTDFADVKMVLSNAGSALMGVGVARGDNRGQTVRHVNVVREIVKLGDWTGRPVLYALPADRAEGESVAVLVQAKGDRRILNAATN